MSLFLSEMWASPNVSAHRMSRRLFLAALGKNRGVSSGLTQASALVWEALLFWSFDWNLESAGNAKTPGWDDVRWRDWIAGADSWARPHERPADGGLFWSRSRDTPASKAHRFSLCVAGRKMPFINGSHNHIRAWFYSLASVLQLSVFSYISFWWEKV